MLVVMLTRMLIQEHKYRPITGKVLALGKQSIVLDAKTIRHLFSEVGCPVNPNLDETAFRAGDMMRVQGEILDSDFMKFFGEDIDYKTLDVSDHEGADIIHDLNHPIPKELEGQFDFIIDGGTFDHLLDLRTAFRNVVKMLKPGGRIFQWNAASNYANAAYISMSADLFFDYYLINKFADCRVYFAEGLEIASHHWRLTEFRPDGKTPYGHLKSPDYVMTVLLAEKGMDSTDDRIPIQQQYRDPHLRQEYIDNLNAMRRSPRPRLIAIPMAKAPPAGGPPTDFSRPVPPGYERIGWL